MNINQLSELIEEELCSLPLPKQPKNLFDPIAYILSIGGKRLRPLLVLLAYKLYKSDPKKIIKPALAIELFHNFTLMHDDIMDHAPLRRGQLTVHKKWNQTTAILSGDALLILSYRLLENIEPKNLPLIFTQFNECAMKVCAGQQWDMDFESLRDVSEKQYLDMIQMKTAVLIGFSLAMGGILADAPPKEISHLEKLGVNLGMSFQLMDDYLDAFGTASFGKQKGGDIMSNKKTFLLINTLETGTRKNREKLQKWINIQEENPTKVKEVIHIYLEEKTDLKILEKVNEYLEMAHYSLKQLKGDKETKEMLESYIFKLKKRMS